MLEPTFARAPILPKKPALTVGTLFKGGLHHKNPTDKEPPTALPHQAASEVATSLEPGGEYAWGLVAFRFRITVPVFGKK
jgi:hypothetical protein